MSDENTSQAEQPVIEESVEDSGQQSQEASGEIDAIEEAVANGDISEKQAQSMIKKFQLKVNGKSYEKEIDLSDENAVRNELQLSAAARQAMSESSNLKKQYEKELARLKQDPYSVLAELGLDPDQLAEMRIQQRIEEMKKSPEQVEREKIQKELQEAREEARKLKEEKETNELTKLQEQAAIQIEDEITKALDAHQTLPKSRHVVKRIADSMLWAMNNGFENVTAEDVIPMVEKDLTEEYNRLMDDAPEEMLERLIGKRNIDRLRAKRVAQAKTSPLNAVKPTANSVKEQKEEPRKKISQREFFSKLGKK